jgi:hypothetical protein
MQYDPPSQKKKEMDAVVAFINGNRPLESSESEVSAIS